MTEQTRRSTRLIRIEQLLRKHPAGLTTGEIARETGYSPRTIQRDIIALESELGVPLLVEGRRYQIMPGSHGLAPVRFTLQEARAIYVATRLYLRYADDRDADGIAALAKVGDALPDPVAAFIRDTVEQMKKRPRRPEGRVLQAVTEGWGLSRTVHIKYRSASHGGTLRETDIDPYVLEPSAIGNATYVVGFSHEHDCVRTFKIERIQDARVTPNSFAPTDVRGLVDKLAESWGVVFGDEQLPIVVDFSPEVAERVRETVWHPTQRLTPLPDGGVRLELILPSTLEFVPWIRGWGQEAVVVQPESLRDEVAASFAAAAARYTA